MNLGACSITRAELRGAMEGLQLAWNLRFRRVQLELDCNVQSSFCVVEIVRNTLMQPLSIAFRRCCMETGMSLFTTSIGKATNELISLQIMAIPYLLAFILYLVRCRIFIRFSCTTVKVSLRLVWL
ncbi:unnamed protein product [Linum trigynum]|uniref:RNase H type-1 domain-containing protein n=1 Tax=Linum trigynum TaxID=586398 RepID=A0AAV2EL69_9ROSI